MTNQEALFNLPLSQFAERLLTSLCPDTPECRRAVAEGRLPGDLDCVACVTRWLGEEAKEERA